MIRYLRLYLHFLRFSFSRAMEFRVDFYFRIVMDAVFYALHLAFFTILYGHTRELGGWTLDQVYIFVCGYFVLDAVNMTVFGNNLWWLPMYINRGDLDYYLVRPVSSLFFLSLRDFAANSFVNLVMAVGLLVWSIARYPLPLGAGRIGVYLCLIVLGNILFYLLRLLFLLPVFWTHTSRGLDELYFHLEKFAERPHQIYQGWLRYALLTVLPFALLASVPAHALFEELRLDRLLHVLVVTVAAFLVVLWMWGRGLRAYASASS